MNRMRPGVETDVLVGSEAEGARRATGAFGPTSTSRATAPDPEVSPRPSGGASPRSIGSGSSRKRMPARSPVRWARCCAARACTRRC